MTHNFVVYIDEAGDEGYNILKPPEHKSSEWFVLSAVICDILADYSLPKMLSPFFNARGKEAGFHFRSARHHERVAFCETIAKTRLAATVVLAHKPSIADDAALRNRPHYLFDYSTKLLLERVSWYCDEKKPAGTLGQAKIIFSQRRQLKLKRILAYLGHLRNMTDFYGDTPAPELAKNDIRWNVIHSGMIDMQPHDSLPGLQIADAVASGAHRAVELSRYWGTEHRYIKILKPRIWRRRGRVFSYGLKFIPDELPDDDPFMHPQRFHWLHHFR